MLAFASRNGGKISVTSDSGQAYDFVQSYTIVLKGTSDDEE
jgi:hypothetical protein